MPLPVAATLVAAVGALFTGTPAATADSSPIDAGLPDGCRTAGG
jgi:hypothetical protein